MKNLMQGDEAAFDEILRKAEEEKSKGDSKLSDKLAERRARQEAKRLAQQKEFDEENEKYDVEQLEVAHK